MTTILNRASALIRTPRTAAIAAAAVVVSSGLLGGTPAQARDYPYCLTSPGYGYPGDCSYATYQQCRISASGRQADCNLNPRFAYGQPRRQDYRTYGDRW